MIRLAVFDLDGTLAPVGKSIDENVVVMLRELESKGIKIAISSGKTLYYLIGMFRQVGLSSPILIGENGNSIACGIELPPRMLNSVRPSDEYFLARKKILADLSEKFGGMFWLQPNEVMLTVFFKDKKTCGEIRDCLASVNCDDIVVYEHIDSFDIVPKGIDKKTALVAVGEELGYHAEEMIAIGDGMNDIPMMEYCKYSIGIAPLDKSLTMYHFDEIGSALKFLLTLTESEKFYK